jgi:Transketolase, C-terminal domain
MNMQRQDCRRAGKQVPSGAVQDKLIAHQHPSQVIDLISLKPFDMEAITNSVHKTKRVIIVEECMKTGGIGASLSATINESCFDHLDHQVRRRSCPGACAGAGMSGGGPSACFGVVTCLACCIWLDVLTKLTCIAAWRQVVRLSSQDVPTAYAYELEAATIVQPEQVIRACISWQSLLSFDSLAHYTVNVSNMAWLLQTQVVSAVKRVVGSRVAA